MNTLNKVHSIFTNIFPVTPYFTFNPVALDISTDAVRVMHLNKDKKGFLPNMYKEIPLKTSCDILENEDDLKRCDELKSVLIDLKKEFHLDYVTVSLPESKTYIFKTEIPQEAIATIEDTLLFKIEENVPIPPEDIVFEYKAIPGSVKGNKLEVVVSTLPKNVVEIYSKLFDEVGLTPLSFEPESHPLAKAVVKEGDISPYLILNMKRDSVNMSIVEHNTVHYTSTFPVPSEDVVKDLNGPAAKMMKEQINKLLIYWFTNQSKGNPQDKIQTVILSGSYALAPGLTTFLERRLKVNVRVANIWANCFDLNEHVPMISYKKSLDYGTAVGLALGI